MAFFRFPHRRALRPLLLGATCLTLAACDGGFDFDMRDLGGGFDTSTAAQTATAPRPAPDNRGVISYPNYQVALAQGGDTVADVARRVGLPPEELARYNGLTTGDVMRDGELIALPQRVTEPSPATGAASTGPLRPSTVDVTELAGSAIASAEASQPDASSGVEPIRHKVEPGETAFSIARLYKVPPAALGEWNGLDSSLSVREGQILLIPVVLPDATPAAQVVNTPGTESPTPTPPSSVQPLPADNPDISTPVPAPPSPNLGEQQTGLSTSSARMIMPVKGPIIGDFEFGEIRGLKLSAPSGAEVLAADAGNVAAIREDTELGTFILVDHGDNLYSAYQNLDNLVVSEGQAVARGQEIASVGKSVSATGTSERGRQLFVFSLFRGTDPIDPTPYLK